MGLDVLDLIFRLEHRFKIKIVRKDSEAFLFDTVGVLHRYLVAVLHGERQEIPQLGRLSAEIARASNRILGFWKQSLANNLNKRFPPNKREAYWTALGDALGVALPELEHPPGGGFPRIPRHCDTPWSLASWIAKQCPSRVPWVTVVGEPHRKITGEPWTEEEVWIGLRECICESLGVRPEEVTPDARWVEELGMG